MRHFCWWWTEPWSVIGQNLMPEPCMPIGWSWILSSDWSGTDGQFWVNLSELSRDLWLVRNWWSNLGEIEWTEPWCVIGQNLMTEIECAEPWVLIGQSLMSESHKLAGWNLSTTSWPVWGLSTTSWPDKGNDIKLRDSKIC
jgi:hypothetical protein